MKERIHLDIVEETLVIPLYLRSKESQRIDPILKDELACELISKIEYDFSKFDKSDMSALGCVIRANHFDNKTRSFISKEKNPVIVNVGCGLDTRYQRIHDKKDAIFYELDLPNVIGLRRKLINEAANDINISSSMLETQWMDDLRSKHPNSNFIFIVEGVIMYLHENDIKSFLNNLAVRFKGGEVHFDVCGSLFLKKVVKNDSVKHTKAQFLSAMDDGKIVETWVPNLVMTDNLDYFKMEKKRWGWIGFFMRLIPGLSRRISRILGFAIK